MQTQRLDLVAALALKRYTTYHLHLTFRQPDGTPLDLTACEAQAQIRSNFDAATFTAFTVTFDPDRTTGQIKLVMDKSNYDLLSSGKYIWDMLLQLADGSRYAPLEGDVLVRSTSTQWQI